MNPEQHTIMRHLGPKEFEGMKIRVGKYSRIAEDLGGIPPLRKQRVNEIQAIERRIHERGRGDEKSGRHERLVDTRGYREARRTIRYVSPTGDTFDANVVMFYKKEKNTVEWLASDGRTIVLDAGLYENRLPSTLYNQQSDRIVHYIPYVDDRGAYNGVITIIEEKRRPGRALRQPDQKSLVPGFHLSSDAIKLIAERFGKPDVKKPRKPEHYFAPIVSNIFSEHDVPTLAGKMVCHLYDTLIMRTTDRVQTYDGEYSDLGTFAFDTFNTYVPKILNARTAQGNDQIKYLLDRGPGTDAFHFAGDTTVVQSFLFYFNKSRSHWQHPHDRITRAYITLDQNNLRKTPIHFVDLCLVLYDAGVDFSAKCTSPYGQARRMENIVVYIAESDRDRASDIIKQFMTERKLGKGHLLAASPSAQDGLSWAYEPAEYEMRLWREISGSSRSTSFNMIATMYALPLHLDALIVACLKVGDSTSAEKYQKEAERMRALFKKYRVTH